MHYKDGTPAKLFDVVKGKPYNTPHEVIGVVGSLHLGNDSCGIYVMFTAPGQAWGGAPIHVNTIGDYGTVSDFELVHRHGFTTHELGLKELYPQPAPVGIAD